MSETHDLLDLLRSGPVNQTELIRRYGPYRKAALFRLLAAEGHIVATEHRGAGTFYRLAYDASDQQRLEGTA